MSRGTGKFIIGAGLGAAIALLLAPKKGSELREDIAEKARELLDKAKDVDSEDVKKYVEKKVAEIMGISPASVARYIIPNYVSKKERKTYTFNGYVGDSKWLIDIFKTFDNPGASLCELCMLGKNEWEEMQELQKEIYL